MKSVSSFFPKRFLWLLLSLFFFCTFIFVKVKKENKIQTNTSMLLFSCLKINVQPLASYQIIIIGWLSLFWYLFFFSIYYLDKFFSLRSFDWTTRMIRMIKECSFWFWKTFCFLFFKYLFVYLQIDSKYISNKIDPTK